MTEKLVKCEATWNSGNFETDNLIIKSPTGKILILKYHKNEVRNLRGASQELYKGMLEKIWAASKQRYIWEYEHKPKSTSDPKWPLFVEALRLAYPSFGFVWVDLTIKEMNLFKYLVEAK
jgi:hypothetical protein